MTMTVELYGVWNKKKIIRILRQRLDEHWFKDVLLNLRKALYHSPVRDAIPISSLFYPTRRLPPVILRHGCAGRLS